MLPTDEIAHAIVDEILQRFALGLLPGNIGLYRTGPGLRVELGPDVLHDAEAPGLEPGYALVVGIPVCLIAADARRQLVLDALFQHRQTPRPFHPGGIYRIGVAIERRNRFRHGGIGQWLAKIEKATRLLLEIG